MSKHIPNIITGIRILLLPFIYFFYLTDLVPYSPIIAIIIFLIAAATDFLDGYLARKYQVVSDLGKLLDPIADKMLFYSGLFLIMVSNILPVWACALIYFINLCRDFAIDCLRMLASAKGKVLAANMFGKVKTTIAFIAVPWLLIQGIWTDWLVFNIFGYILIGLETACCFLSGLIYLCQNRQVFNSQSISNTDINR